MKKWLRKAAVLVLTLALLCAGAASAGAAVTLPQPDETLLYVTDNANVLSNETKNYIVQRNDILYDATGAQFAVLTVKSLPSGYDSESFCYAVFNDWGIGSADRNNGLLLLLVPDEGRFWMTVGTGLQDTLTGGVINELLDDHLAPDFDAGRYDEATKKLFDAVWQRLEGIYGPIEVNNSQNVPAQPSAPVGGDNTTPVQRPSTLSRVIRGVFSMTSLIILIILLIILAAILSAGRRRRRRVAPPPPPTGGVYYRTRVAPPPRRVAPPPPPRPVAPPPSPLRPTTTPRPTAPKMTTPRPATPPSRPSSSAGRSFGGGSSFGSSSSRSTGGVSRSAGASRSFSGGRSHGGGGGRR